MTASLQEVQSHLDLRIPSTEELDCCGRFLERAGIASGPDGQIGGCLPEGEQFFDEFGKLPS